MWAVQELMGHREVGKTGKKQPLESRCRASHREERAAVMARHGGGLEGSFSSSAAEWRPCQGDFREQGRLQEEGLGEQWTVA